ncbi:GTP cyclohydrolase II [Candidatus Micrarchaeota archaeon]|nr:GTP cyclohydrolase II [Candidatus Micrarchaeota archaeon]
MNSAFFPSKFGEFKIYSSKDNLALIYGNLKEPVLVRVHSRCTTGDVFGSLRCDCGEQLVQAIEMIKKKGNGIILYLDQEGRGIGLSNKIKAYELQDKGADTVEANHQLGFETDLRSYETAAEILKQLEVSRIKLITNNPKKIEGLKINDLEIVERVPLLIPSNSHNEKYLKTKKEKMGHLI